MANRTKLQVCRVQQPAFKAANPDRPAVCDKRPGHKDKHGRKGVRGRW